MEILFDPKDPDFEARVRDSFNRQPFMEYLGARLEIVRPGYCEIHLDYNQRLTQQHGYFHAGIVGTLADNAAGYAAYSLMEATSSILTVEYKINLIAPAKGELLIGRSQVMKYGRTLTICRSEVAVRNGSKEQVCALAQMTLIELRNTSDLAQ